MASSPDVIVIGAGVLGLCTAAELGARGHTVTVIDPGGANASSVAAGMIAPALESLIDDHGAERADLLKRARDLWPDFADTHGLRLHREGAEWRGEDAEAAIRRLRTLGFSAEAAPGGLITSDDWRVEVGAAMTSLRRAPDVSFIRGRANLVSGEGRRWRVAAEDGRVWFASALVLATGAEPAVGGLPASVTALVNSITPIRGQAARVAGASLKRVLRGDGLYAAPVEGGVIIGATMEPDRRDLTPDPAESDRQVRVGLALMGAEAAVGESRVGVRGATSDQLPLAGPSGEAGLHLALAPRRNGWLLGPLVARTVADGIEGQPPVPDAVALDPLRFA
ncbi:MAG TPA: FAD-dependent oxidoreductase [Brevundimonas sp.]|nr:FAD-dependent oxidoreductase [Brevundimonas sp.]